MKVVKKLGHLQDFEIDKIRIALDKTAQSIDTEFTKSDWKELKPRILSRLEPIMEDREEIYAWEIDDAVIDTLLRSRFNDLTREYIETRSKAIKDKLNDLNLSPLAMWLLRERYLKKDDNGQPIETAKEMMCRVSTAVASVEKNQKLRIRYANEFKQMLCNLDFLPNSPCIVSAGANKYGSWLACYAAGMHDSIISIFNTLKLAARIFQIGGGFGTSVSKLREKGAKIKTSNGESSGPISFMELFNTMVDTVRAGGFRKGAQMVIMDYNHPDIEEFIRCKRDTKKLNNMNISVLIRKELIESIKNNSSIDLVSPLDNRTVDTISANLLLETIATNIWETGEPGVLFYENMNRDNPTPHLGDLTVTNPCSESNLRASPGEACDLGSINLVNHLTSDNEIDWDKLAYTTKLSIRFLDNMLDGSPYPSKAIENAVKETRKIGLGVMGFADVLIKMGIRYSSPKAIEMAGNIMSFINDVADKASTELGKEKGIYPAYREGYRKRRNSIVTTEAPTGSISLICGVSSGIEPNFAKEYTRKIDGEVIRYIHPLSNYECFETTYDIEPEQHLKILAEFQKHIENSTSKTCNVPEMTRVDEIKELILKAYDMNVKGITIFRENCKRDPLLRCEDCKI